MQNKQKPKSQISTDLKILRIRTARLEALLADYDQENNKPPETELAKANEALRIEIAERMRAEESLRESEQKYRLLIESMQDVLIQLSPAGKVLYVSPAVKKFGGYDPESEIGSHISKYFENETDAVRAAELLEKVLINGQSGYFEFIFKAKDKKPFPVEHTFVPILKNNNVTAIQLVLRDITKRKRAEEALRAGEERYRGLFENVPVGLYRTTPQGKIMDANPALLKMLGFSDWKTLLATNASDIYVHPDDRRKQQVLLEREGIVCGFETRMRRSDGTFIWVRDTVRVVQNDAGRVLCYEGSLEDITARKQIEIENARLHRQTQKDAETKDILLKEVNHRVKNNLAAIRAMLLFEQRFAAKSPERQAEATLLHELACRINGLSTVHQMLSDSDWSPMPLHKLARQVINGALQARPSGKQIAVDVSSAAVLVTPKQAQYLAVIINEMATNVIKHVASAKAECLITVSITSQPDADTVVFEFRDNGPGFPEKVLNSESGNVGMYLITNTVRHSLGGEIALFNDKGAAARIEFARETAQLNY